MYYSFDHLIGNTEEGALRNHEEHILHKQTLFLSVVTHTYTPEIFGQNRRTWANTVWRWQTNAHRRVLLHVCEYCSKLCVCVCVLLLKKSEDEIEWEIVEEWEKWDTDSERENRGIKKRRRLLITIAPCDAFGKRCAALWCVLGLTIL